MNKVAVTDVVYGRIPGGVDIAVAHSNPNLLCMSAHCWVLSDDGKSVLIQKRSKNMFCNPGLYDISLAGHIDDDEEPLQAMLREAYEEGGVDLRGRIADPKGPIYMLEQNTSRGGERWMHNQLVYMYFAVLSKQEIAKHSSDVDVAHFEWWSLDTFALRTTDPIYKKMSPHPESYYQFVVKKLYELQRTHAKISA